VWRFEGSCLTAHHPKVRLEGFEPPTLGSEDRCSIPLSYSRNSCGSYRILKSNPPQTSSKGSTERPYPSARKVERTIKERGIDERSV
jgi:hypothetical protein